MIIVGDQASLFTGVLFDGYGPPGGFCFQCGDTPIMVNSKKIISLFYLEMLILSLINLKNKLVI